MPPRSRHPTSPPATPLDDDDLLAEFLLRLPPRPSSLPRAAAVCKAWHRVVTDPYFLRRFRAHHRKAPLLGFFDGDGSFFPTLEAPDRVPAARLSVSWTVVACRDGLVLCSEGKKLQVLNPMTGDRSAIIAREDKLPVLLNVELVVHSISTVVERLCFRLLALSTDAYATKLSASVYSSDSGAWTHSVEILVSQSTIRSMSIYPSTFVGNAFYWLHTDGGFVRFDLETQTLTIIEAPSDNYQDDDTGFVMTKDGLVSLTILDEDEPTIQLWVRETILSGAAKWVLRKTVRPDKVLPPPLDQDLYLGSFLDIVGFEEENNVAFLVTLIGLFMFKLESMKFTRVSQEKDIMCIYPYSSFVTAGRNVSLSPVDEVHDRFTEASE